MESSVVGGRVEIDCAIGKRDGGDLIAVRVDDLPRAFLSLQREQFRKHRTCEKRGHAERAAVFRGRDGAAGLLMRGDEDAERGRAEERLIAREKNDGGNRGMRGKQRAQTRAQGTAHAIAPCGVFRDEHARPVEMRADFFPRVRRVPRRRMRRESRAR